MSMIYADQKPKGGQVPLLKHAVMLWLQAENAKGGSIRGDSYEIVRVTRASVPNVARALWDLSRQGLVTFVERKRQGTNGHASTTVLTHFALTPAGLEWTAEKAFIEDMAKVDSMTMADVNPAIRDTLDAQDMADEVMANIPPAQALANLLRRMPSGHGLRIMSANVRLGYAKQSTALYSIARTNPDAFRIEAGEIFFIGPEGWKAKVGQGTHSRHLRRNVPETVVMADTPLTREAIASVALDHDPLEGTQSMPEQPKPVFGPELTALIARSERRAKVAEAVAALEAAGLDDDALTVMGRIPDDSPLEIEVLAYLEATKWLR